MARDFTDYVMEVHGAGDRVYHQSHIRQLKKDPEETEFIFNNRKYLIIKDRAFRVGGYTPWKKWDSKHPFKSIFELFRSKKVGLIKYREPGFRPPEWIEVEREKPVSWSCKLCAEAKQPFETSKESAMKAHITRKHKKGKFKAKFDKIVEVRTETVMEQEKVIEVVEPLHISKMHQPSGILKGSPEEQKWLESLKDSETECLLNILTPRLLKMEIEDDSYRKAYKSYKFGQATPITQKWWIWVIVAMIFVFVVLYMTGNFNVR